MPNVQSTYSENLRKAIPGQKGTMVPATLISRTVENAEGVGFGKAVSRAVNDNGCKAFTTGDTAILGITILDRSANATGFAQYDSARIMTKGDVWVTVAQAVNDGDPVYVRPSNGDFQKDNTNSAVLLAGAVYDTTAGIAGLALVRMG